MQKKGKQKMKQKKRKRLSDQICLVRKHLTKLLSAAYDKTYNRRK